VPVELVLATISSSNAYWMEMHSKMLYVHLWHFEKILEDFSLHYLACIIFICQLAESIPFHSSDGHITCQQDGYSILLCSDYVKRLMLVPRYSSYQMAS
jgi:hypothetical protein